MEIERNVGAREADCHLTDREAELASQEVQYLGVSSV